MNGERQIQEIYLHRRKNGAVELRYLSEYQIRTTHIDWISDIHKVLRRYSKEKQPIHVHPVIFQKDNSAIWKYRQSKINRKQKKKHRRNKKGKVQK